MGRTFILPHTQLHIAQHNILNFTIYDVFGSVSLSQVENKNSNTEYMISLTQERMKFQQEEGQYHG